MFCGRAVLTVDPEAGPLQFLTPLISKGTGDSVGIAGTCVVVASDEKKACVECASSNSPMLFRGGMAGGSASSLRTGCGAPTLFASTPLTEDWDLKVSVCKFWDARCEVSSKGRDCLGSPPTSGKGDASLPSPGSVIGGGGGGLSGRDILTILSMGWTHLTVSLSTRREMFVGTSMMFPFASQVVTKDGRRTLCGR